MKFTSRVVAGAIRRGAAVLCALAATAGPALAADPELRPYLLGVFPHLSISRLEAIYAPLAREIGNAIGRPVQFRTRSNFGAFTDELDNGTYDIALVQPFDYIRVHDTRGYLPMARRGEPLSAVIVVASEAPYRSLADLRGTIIALPPEVAAVSHLTRIALSEAGLDPARDVTLVYDRNHDGCLQRVMIGAASACGTASGPVRFFQAKMKVLFRVLAESPSIPHVLFIIHPRVPPQERERALAAIVGLPSTPTGRAIIDEGQLKPFVPVTDAEYDVVRRYWARIDR